MLRSVIIDSAGGIAVTARQVCRWLLSTLVALLSVMSPSRAEDDVEPRHYEVWAGADAAQDVWLLYSGTTFAPFGDINRDGLRLRFSGGYGQYSYSGKRPEINPAYTGLDDEPMILTPYKTFHARVQFAEALVGYQWQWGELTTKAFLGITSIDHDISPDDRFTVPTDVFDPQAGTAQTISFNLASGHDIGWKGVIEFWLNIGTNAYGSVDLAWSDAHLTRSARARFGHNVLPELYPGLSAGLEASFNLNRNGEARLKNDSLVNDIPLDYARFGGFARYAWDTGEISASVGLLGDFTEDQSAYGTVNLITKF